MKHLFSLKFLLIFLTVSTAKVYEQCELAKELYHDHKVSIFDIKDHLYVIGDTLNTGHQAGSADSGYDLGLYRIASKWWCKIGEEGGNCEMDCNNLIKDDIEQQVQCGKKILSLQGVTGWGITDCKKYEAATFNCLKVEIVREALKQYIQRRRK